MFARFFLLSIFVLYCFLFQIHDRQLAETTPSLSLALPSPVQEVFLGYLKELGSEMLFIKVAVFLGRNDLPKNKEDYAAVLTQNFHVMTDIYPEFIDPYYLCESSLPFINRKSAIDANEILLKGTRTHPDDIIIPFFRGFNYFYYLNQPKKAAAIFSDLAGRPGAPNWFGHLAGILSARGGDLYGGLLTLKAMLATEKDENIRDRYRRHIKVFEEAIKVYEALEAFKVKEKHYPEELEQLVPEYLSAVPVFDGEFSISWDPPNFRLLRPLTIGELSRKQSP